MPSGLVWTALCIIQIKRCVSEIISADTLIVLHILKRSVEINYRFIRIIKSYN
jgi:hypothetical protein